MKNSRNQHDPLKNWQKFLQEVGVNYFSFTFFGDSTPLLSFCNHHDWTVLFKKDYLPVPPVQPHILKTRSGLLIWDEDFFDNPTAQYITRRSEVTDTKSIWTLVKPFEDLKLTMTFGSQYGKDHLYRFLTRNKAEITSFSEKITGRIL